MKREKLRVCYDGSGIKALRSWATFFVVYSIIGVLLTIVGFISSTDGSNILGVNSKILLGISAFLTGCIISPIFRGLATIAETALLNKHIMMMQYDIVESDQSSILYAQKSADYDNEKNENEKKLAISNELKK